MSFEFSKSRDAPVIDLDELPFTAKDVEILYGLVCAKEQEIYRDWERTQRRGGPLHAGILANVEWRMTAYNTLGRKLIAIFDEVTRKEVNQ